MTSEISHSLKIFLTTDEESLTGPAGSLLSSKAVAAMGQAMLIVMSDESKSLKILNFLMSSPKPKDAWGIKYVRRLFQFYAHDNEGQIFLPVDNLLSISVKRRFNIGILLIAALTYC